tara:strand:- start:1285 stop:2385 length:1101 start_codon:yes stop_codon:yes gene_type:complete
MDNIIIGNQSLTDSDYESSDEEPENINYHNIDYDNKYFHNNSLQSEYQTTRNKLFTKDIIKQRILIDTHNIKVQGTDISQSLKTNNYTYFLYKNSEEAHSSTENYNETGGYDRYKNVIGFRFIKAIIPNRSYTVNNTNNTFIVRLDSDNSVSSATVNIAGDRDKRFKIILQNGFFDTDTITESFTNAIYESIDTNTTGSSYLKNLYEITPSFDSQHKLFTFTMKNSVKFKLLWSDNTNNYNDAKTLLGFLTDTPDFSNSIVGETTPDMSVHYFDIVIPEIPYIACKHNTEKKRIIERIPITSAMDELLIYEDTSFNIEDQNYFFPISLHKLTIQLYQKNGNFFDNNNKHHSLEFEITMINKVDLIK